MTRTRSKRTPHRPLLEILERRDLPTFVSAPSYPVVLQPHSVAAGDFNGDGFDDMAVTAYGGNGGVRVLISAGDGSFAWSKDHPTGAPTRAVVVADLSGDGILDLVASNSVFPVGSISVLIGRGDGNFRPAVNYAAGEAPSGVAVADFNSDAKPDLAVSTDAAGATVKIFLGNGNGTFGTPVGYECGSYSYGVTTSDFDADGDFDLAVVNAYHNTVRVLLGNGNGSFAPSVPYGVGANPVALVSGDLNGDGKSDLAIANFGSNSVSVVRGKGDGTFQSALTFAAGTAPQSIAALDVEGDGDLDLVVPNIDVTTVTVLRNQLGAYRRRISYLTDGGPHGVAAGDFNNDGNPDIVTANKTTNTISVLRGLGGGTFFGATTYPSGKFALDVASGDLNGDGDLDLAVGGYDGDKGMVTILTGAAGASFKIKSTVAIEYPRQVATEDLDGDGIRDLVALRSNICTSLFWAGSATVVIDAAVGDGQLAIR